MCNVVTDVAIVAAWHPNIFGDGVRSKGTWNVDAIGDVIIVPVDMASRSLSGMPADNNGAGGMFSDMTQFGPTL